MAAAQRRGVAARLSMATQLKRKSNRSGTAAKAHARRQPQHRAASVATRK